MTIRRTLLFLLAAAALVAVVVWHVLPTWKRTHYAADHAAAAPTEVDTLGVLDPSLNESSGLAVSRRWPGVLWTHNDSGDRPRFYAMDLQGRVTGTWSVTGAHAVDWEDMDRGPCPAEDDARDCLYLADTGDNERVRDTLTVYVVPEPNPTDSASSHQLAPLGTLRFSYPDERHDTEALAVAPDGDLVFVTKGRTARILLYTLPAAEAAAALDAARTFVLSPGRALPMLPDWGVGRVVTGASFSPGGTRLAVRTYSEIYVFPWPLPAGPVPAAPSCFLGRLEPQGEAVAWDGDASVLLTSEDNAGREGMLLRVKCANLAPEPAR